VRGEGATVARRLAARVAQRLWRNDGDRNHEDGQDRYEKSGALSIQSPSAKDVDTVNVNPVGAATQSTATSRPHKIWSWLLSLYRRFPGVIASGAVAVVFAVGYLLAPPMGRDYSAQLAYAELAKQHWPELLDLRWYGGFDPLGYSVWSPPVMALLGVPLTTALAYVASVVLFAALLKRVDAARPVLGAITAAVCLTGNLVVVRTTFMLGLVVALGALLAFLAVAGSALFLAGRRRDGLTLAISGLAPTIAVGLVFGNGGRQSFAEEHALMGFLICLLVAGVCWRRPIIRWGAFLTAGLVAAAFFLPTPVGTNATRLIELFAAPIIVAFAMVPSVAVVAATASAVLLVPPVSITEIQERGDPALSAAYYARLLDQLAARGTAGPIEVVPTQRRGEAALVAPIVAIARGWSRQADIGRNPIFYDGTLNADTYQKWLDDNAISYVALSKGPYDWAAPDEANLVRSGLPNLRAVWANETWTLYAVTNPRPVVSPPGQVVARDAISLTLALPEPGEYVVRVRWSRYVSASSGCVRRAEGGWSEVVVQQPGTVKIEGSLAPRHC
jgi:hypothetical protein